MTLDMDGSLSEVYGRPALVELVISADGDEAARARALQLLGFAAHLPVRVVAVRVAASTRPGWQLGLPGPTGEGGTARRRGRHPGHHRGPGPVSGRRTRGHRRRRKPHQSWQEARTALRVTTSRQPVVHFDGLGALALLAQVPQQAARDNADVAAIARMAGNPEDLQTLDTYCATGSQRRAADLLHLHHSSVARRLEQIGATLEDQSAAAGE